jgi:hypothetical protein
MREKSIGLNRTQFYSALFFLLPLLVFCARPISTEDLSVWVAQGLECLRTMSIVRQDTFSALPSFPLVYPAGIAILYAVIFKLGGLSLVVMLHRLALFLVLILLYRNSIAKASSFWSARNGFLVILCLAGCVFGFVERPSLVAELPFLLAYLLLQKNSDLSRKDLGILVGIMVLWVNLHGSFFLLPVLFGWRLIFTAIEAKFRWREPGPHKREIVGFFLVLAAALLNPFGWRIFPYVWETATVSMRRVEEWQVTSPSAYFPQGLIFYLLVAVVLRFFYVRYRNKAFPLRSPFLALLLLGFTAIRHTDLAFLAALPFFAQKGFLQDGDGEEGSPRIFNLAVVVGIAFLCVAFSPGTKHRFSFLLPEKLAPTFSSTAPAQFARILNQDPSPGNIFNHWDFGSFLTLAQNRKIYLDSRNIIYSDAAIREYDRVLEAGVDWDVSLRNHQVLFVLVKPENQRLISTLSERGWLEMGRTEGAVLLRRP